MPSCELIDGRVRLSEWASCEFESGPPTSNDRAFAAQLSSGDPRLIVDWLDGGRVRVGTRSCVGTVQFSRFGIEIEPKLAGGHRNVFRMLAVADGIDLVQPIGQMRELPTGAGLFDWLAHAFVDAVAEILRQGVLQDYVEREEDLRFLRGQLRALDQVRRHAGMVDPLECRYEELEADIWENQLLAAAAEAALPLTRDVGVRRRMALTKSMLEAACSMPDVRHARSRGTPPYHRRNDHYRNSHYWAMTILKGLEIADLFGGASPQARAFLIDMNDVFERFVLGILEVIGPHRGWAVKAQAVDRSVIVRADGKPYQRVVPDAMMRLGSRKLPIDSKYKLYDEKRLDPSDIYQLGVYAFAYGEANSRDALLIYPRTGAAKGQQLFVRSGQGDTMAKLTTHPMNIDEVLHRWASRAHPIDSDLFDLLVAYSGPHQGSLVVAS